MGVKKGKNYVHIFICLVIGLLSFQIIKRELAESDGFAKTDYVGCTLFDQNVFLAAMSRGDAINSFCSLPVIYLGKFAIIPWC